ncbi:MAG: hypothetical protein V7708_00330 [Oceanicoccus sp.]
MSKLTTQIITILLFSFFSCFNLHAAETDPVVEAYSCNYLEGKNQQDLNSAIEFWQKGMGKLNSEAMKSYFGVVLNPINSSFGADFYWLGSNTNLNTWAAGNADYFGSKVGQDADKKFAKMSKCTSNLFFSKPLYEGLTPATDGTGAVIMTAACTLKEGKTLQNAMAVEGPRIAELVANKAQTSVYRLVPYIANTPYDLLYLIVHSDLKAFASAGTRQITSEAWMATNEAFTSTMHCESGLFNSQVVHLPAVAAQN